MTWPIVNIGGIDYYHFTGDIDIPVEPSSGVAALYLRPAGGSAGAGIPAIEQGAPGLPANLDTTVTFTELAAGDSTAAAWSLEQITPPSGSTPGLYRFHGSLHKGAQGDPGDTVLTPSDYTGHAPGKTLVINSAGTAFIVETPKVGDRYLPASISNTSSGNSNSTLCAVSVPSQDFDWRPEVHGYTIVTKTGANVVVDLIARLNTETSGNIVGICHGLGGTERLHLTPGPEATPAAADYDKVVAGAAAVIYLRTEQHSGSDSYTTSNTTTRCWVKVNPIP